ncbi:MAG: hypothetical protein WAU78_02635 [Roseiarcus sp.]
MANLPEAAPDIATKIMAAMVRMPPKPHEKMKLKKSKTKAEKKANPARERGK